MDEVVIYIVVKYIFTALVEELATKKHDVTVIKYHPVRQMPTQRQISLQVIENASDLVNIEDHLKLLSISDFSVAYDEAHSYKYLANKNCKKLMNNLEVQKLITSCFFVANSSTNAVKIYFTTI